LIKKLSRVINKLSRAIKKLRTVIEKSGRVIEKLRTVINKLSRVTEKLSAMIKKCRQHNDGGVVKYLCRSSQLVPSFSVHGKVVSSMPHMHQTRGVTLIHMCCWT